MSDQYIKVPRIREPFPTRKGNRKVVLLLLFFFLVVFMILFSQSSLSKVMVVEVSGNELVISAEIIQASQIEIGDHFFAIRSAKVIERVQMLPTIKSVSVQKRFPGNVMLRVEEYPRVAFQLLPHGQAQAVLADGSVVDVKWDQGIPLDKPVLSGWQHHETLLPILGQTLEQIPEHLLSDVSELIPDPSEAYPDRLKIYTRSRFIVYTTIEYLPEKIKYLDLFVDQLQQNGITSGTITLLESDGYAPFLEKTEEKEL